MSLSVAEDLQRIAQARAFVDPSGGVSAWPRKADLKAAMSGGSAVKSTVGPAPPNQALLQDSVIEAKRLAATDALIYADVVYGIASDAVRKSIMMSTNFCYS